MSNDKAAAARHHLETPDCWCQPALIAIPDGEDLHEIWVHQAEEADGQ